MRPIWAYAFILEFSTVAKKPAVIYVFISPLLDICTVYVCTICITLLPLRSTTVCYSVYTHVCATSMLLHLQYVCICISLLPRCLHQPAIFANEIQSKNIDW